jgi:hypothetical protein
VTGDVNLLAINSILCRLFFNSVKEQTGTYVNRKSEQQPNEINNSRCGIGCERITKSKWVQFHKCGADHNANAERTDPRLDIDGVLRNSHTTHLLLLVHSHPYDHCGTTTIDIEVAKIVDSVEVTVVVVTEQHGRRTTFFIFGKKVEIEYTQQKYHVAIPIVLQQYILSFQVQLTITLTTTTTSTSESRHARTTAEILRIGELDGRGTDSELEKIPRFFGVWSFFFADLYILRTCTCLFCMISR